MDSSEREIRLTDKDADAILKAKPTKKYYDLINSTKRPKVEIIDRKSTRLNSSHTDSSRMPSSA